VACRNGVVAKEETPKLMTSVVPSASAEELQKLQEQVEQLSSKVI
jgi:hypothetical protein